MSASRQQRCKRVAITSLDWHRSAAEGWLEESFALGCGRQPEPVKAECAARLATGGLGGVLGQTPGLHSAWELGPKLYGLTRSLFLFSAPQRHVTAAQKAGHEFLRLLRFVPSSQDSSNTFRFPP